MRLPGTCPHPRSRLQDVFHLQIMDGNLTRNLETYFPLLGEAPPIKGPGGSCPFAAGPQGLGGGCPHLPPVAASPSLLPSAATGHIQIAQVPARQEPDTHGEVNFPYLFQQLESLGYTGYVGCEYTPRGEWARCRGLLPHPRALRPVGSPRQRAHVRVARVAAPGVCAGRNATWGLGWQQEPDLSHPFSSARREAQ